MNQPKYNRIDRKTAKTLAYKKFYTGRPCKHGHDSQRYTQNGVCCACATISARKNRNKVTNSCIWFKRLIHPAETEEVVTFFKGLEARRAPDPTFPVAHPVTKKPIVPPAPEPEGFEGTHGHFVKFEDVKQLVDDPVAFISSVTTVATRHKVLAAYNEYANDKLPIHTNSDGMECLVIGNGVIAFNILKDRPDPIAIIKEHVPPHQHDAVIAAYHAATAPIPPVPGAPS